MITFLSSYILFQPFIQQWLRKKHKLSVIVKHYKSGTYSFDIQKHNGDSTGWTKLSGFMEKSFYTYNKAFKAGLQEALKLI